MNVSLLVLLLAADPEPAVVADPAVTSAAVIESAAMAERLKVPALTPVFVKVDQELSSKRSKPGDRFPILIAEDVRIDGRVVIPAGAAGEGEVIHAAKSSVGGKAGELILAARFVKVGDVDVPLRSMVLGGAGKDRMNESLAASFVYGVGFFVVGGAVIVPRDTLASAKTAVEIELPVQLAAPAAPPTAPAESAPAEPVDGNLGGDTDEKKTD